MSDPPPSFYKKEVFLLLFVYLLKAYAVNEMC